MKTLKYLAVTLISLLLVNCSNSDLDQNAVDKIELNNISSAPSLIGFPGTSEEDVVIEIERCVDRNGVICDNPCDCRELSEVCEQLCDFIIFEPIQFYSKKFKGRICDEEWSCMPKRTFLGHFKIDIRAAIPEKLDAAIVNKYGEVYASTYLVGFDKKSGVSRLGFQIENEELANGKLVLEILNTVIDQEENIIEENAIFELRDDMFTN